MMLPVHCTHIIQPMPCALSCVNSIALFCHAQLGISRCDGPAVCRTSLFLSLLSTSATTGCYTGLHQARVRVSTALSNARQDVRYHRHLGGTPAVRSTLRLFRLLDCLAPRVWYTVHQTCRTGCRHGRLLLLKLRCRLQTQSLRPSARNAHGTATVLSLQHTPLAETITAFR